MLTSSQSRKLKMPLPKITALDRAIVKARVAAGLSYAKAKEGTKIRSTNTVMRIVKADEDTIARMRSDFVLMVESLGGEQEKQAQQLANMVTAQKPFGKDAELFDDWKSQLEAIKFILELRGVVEPKGGGPTFNILNNPKFIAKYDERK